MSSEPLVSVIIPVYNAETFIRKALESAINQTYRNLEIVVVDDGSRDRTLEVVNSLNDPRILSFRQENAGQGPARNRAMRECRGDLITFLDADDYYLPRKIEAQVNFLRENLRFRAVYCGFLFYYSDERDKMLELTDTDWISGNVLSGLLKTSYINPNTLMIAREVMDKIGYWNETRYYPEDWEYCLRIALAGYDIGRVAEQLAVIQVRPGSNTTLEIQPTLKSNAISMFVHLFPVEVDGVLYTAESILRSLRIKLGIACVVNGRIREAAVAFGTALGNSLAGWAAALALATVPRSVLRRRWQRNLGRRARLVAGTSALSSLG